MGHPLDAYFRSTSAFGANVIAMVIRNVHGHSMRHYGLSGAVPSACRTENPVFVLWMLSHGAIMNLATKSGESEPRFCLELECNLASGQFGNRFG
jgi:hypothetical protein